MIAFPPIAPLGAEVESGSIIPGRNGFEHQK